jgi:tyrosine-protein kinase Etk/Wzc
VPDQVPLPIAPASVSPSALVPGLDLAVPAPARRAQVLDAFGDPREESIDWRRSLAAIRRYRWWIAALTVLGAAGGVLATRIMPARYQAVATIWIQTPTDARGSTIRGPIGTDQLLPSAGAIPLMKSYVVLDGVVRERRLYLHTNPRDRAALKLLTVQERFQPGLYRLRVDGTGKTYRLEGANGVELEHGVVGDSIGRAFGIVWAPTAAVLGPGSDIAFGLSPLRDAAQGLANALNAGVDVSGNFLRIALTGDDPVTTAATVNAVLEHYVGVATELKRVKLTELARLLDDQLAAAKENLRRAEDALAGFRTRTITLGPDLGAAAAPAMGAGGAGGAQSSGDYFRLRLDVDQLRRDREAIARALAPRGDSGSVDGLAYIGAVQRSPDLTQALQELTTKRAELRALRYRYTDGHPTVRRLADDLAVLEGRTIPALAQTVMAELLAREQALTPQLAAGGRELQQVPQRAVEEARLRRDADLAAGLYTAVQQRQSEARLAEASSIADVRILDAAVPPRAPVKAADSRLIILGLLFGLGLGLVGAVIADRFDPRVRHIDQVTHEMGLPILGALPHVKNRDAGPHDEQVAMMIDAMRSIRLNVVHAYGAAGPLVVTITSPGIGDGKSFVSTNLALACAQAGQRTLLVDGDARRGTLNRALGVSRKPGLTDFLSGRAPFESTLQATSYSGLHFIGAGSRLRESPELLGSPAMVDLVVRVRASYDAVIVDSPPLGAGVDAFSLGTLTGAMVLVLRTGATNLDIARTHLMMIQRLPIRLLGAVLNDVQPGGMYGYYYLAGYGTDEEGLGEGTEVEVEIDGAGVAVTRQRVTARSSSS